jgi:hypothetical protein
MVPSSELLEGITVHDKIRDSYSPCQSQTAAIIEHSMTNHDAMTPLIIISLKIRQIIDSKILKRVLHVSDSIITSYEQYCCIETQIRKLHLENKSLL